MIKLMDLIGLAGVKLGKFKIHCVTGDNPTPLEAFYDGTFKQWQESQNNRNFECEHVISLIQLGNSDWLFAGAYKILGVQQKANHTKTWYEYLTAEINGIEHLVGRAVVSFEKKFRASYLRGERYADSLIIKEIKAERQSIGEFPGFNRTCVSYRVLKTIV